MKFGFIMLPPIIKSNKKFNVDECEIEMISLNDNVKEYFPDHLSSMRIGFVIQSMKEIFVKDESLEVVTSLLVPVQGDKVTARLVVSQGKQELFVDMPCSRFPNEDRIFKLETRQGESSVIYYTNTGDKNKVTRAISYTSTLGLERLHD